MSRVEHPLAAVAYAVAICGALAAPAAGQGVPDDPDWPCHQRKVPSLTPAAVWTGPPLDDASGWRDDKKVVDLVRELSQRRLPIEQAEAEVRTFAEGLDPAARKDGLTLLFAGLFHTMNGERGKIIAGIERYARHQKALAEQIREEAAKLDQADTNADTTDAREKLRWDQRIFDERRSSLSYICDAPRLVEQRLFALGRAIGEAMPD
ncbi:hypothetical protein [Consotaella aegiceratis]|uniref:hypothetical protein n=1 Tax=Consotaella aegiceratis TaxID=3097961 RepID=UPI002F426701